jgi:hypothetical protein
MGTLDTIAERIIKEQELVIGPLAWSEAAKVSGMLVAPNHSVTIQNGDPKAAVDRLVAQYERLFGRASHEVCREAVATLVKSMPPAEVPASLR